MNLPDTLQPLPVPPATEEETAARTQESEAFVSDQSVRQLLVGPLSVEKAEPQFHMDGDGFAGRQASPFVSMAGKELFGNAPAKAFAPSGPHPALAEPRRAAPPVPRTELEASFGRHDVSERRLIVAMGVAASAMLIATVLSGFTDSASIEPSRQVNESPAAQPAPAPTEAGDPALAFTGEEVSLP